ncbi:MAG: HNH endonuclease [Caulobacterales bacterium]
MTDAPQNPPDFFVRTEAQQAAYDHGWRIEQGWSGAWGSWASYTAPGIVFIAGAGAEGPWWVATDHPGVAAELDTPSAQINGPGLKRFLAPTRLALNAVLGAMYRLATSLPSWPLQRYIEETKKALPSTTEVEQIVKKRVGQSIFRDALLAYWNGRCPLTGITDPALLRASHIVPWAECDDDAHRLDVHNGLLLSALWDAAFDRGLVSFDDDGGVLYAPLLTDGARSVLSVSTPAALPLTDKLRKNLARHRAMNGF